MDQIVLVRNSESKKERKVNYAEYIEPAFIVVCQVTALILMFGVMSTLTDNLVLSVPYALFITLMLPAGLSLLMSQSAMQFEAVGVLLKSPGGFVAAVIAVAIGAFIWLIQPVLIRNGYGQFQAIASTLLVQIPLAGAVSVMSKRQLQRIFSEMWYRRAVDALERENNIKRQIEAMQLIRRFVNDVHTHTKGKPIEAQMRALVDSIDTKLSNMRTAIDVTCKSGPTYSSPIYALLYETIGDHMARLTAPEETVTLPEELNGVPGMNELMKAIGRGDLRGDM
jgi:hypothetical protein